MSNHIHLIWQRLVNYTPYAWKLVAAKTTIWQFPFGSLQAIKK